MIIVINKDGDTLTAVKVDKGYENDFRGVGFDAIYSDTHHEFDPIPGTLARFARSYENSVEVRKMATNHVNVYVEV